MGNLEDHAGDARFWDYPFEIAIPLKKCDQYNHFYGQCNQNGLPYIHKNAIWAELRVDLRLIFQSDPYGAARNGKDHTFQGIAQTIFRVASTPFTRIHFK